MIRKLKNWNRERLITLLILFSLVVSSKTFLAQEQIIRRGTIITVEGTDGDEYVGELIRVMKDFLVINTPEDTVYSSVNIGTIKTIRIKKSATVGVLVGITAGAFLGGFVTFILATWKKNKDC